REPLEEHPEAQQRERAGADVPVDDEGTEAVIEVGKRRMLVGVHGCVARSRKSVFAFVIRETTKRQRQPVVSLLPSPFSLLTSYFLLLTSYFLLLTSYLSRLPQRCQLVRLVLVHQRIDDFIEFALHNLFELVERQVDAVIGDAALREIVGADALGAIAGTHQLAARLALLGRLPFALGVQQPCLQQRHRAGAVLVLRAFVLAFPDDAGRQM